MSHWSVSHSTVIKGGDYTKIIEMDDPETCCTEAQMYSQEVYNSGLILHLSLIYNKYSCMVQNFDVKNDEFLAKYSTQNFPPAAVYVRLIQFKIFHHLKFVLTIRYIIICD